MSCWRGISSRSRVSLFLIVRHILIHHSVFAVNAQVAQQLASYLVAGGVLQGLYVVVGHVGGGVGGDLHVKCDTCNGVSFDRESNAM